MQMNETVVHTSSWKSNSCCAVRVSCKEIQNCDLFQSCLIEETEQVDAKQSDGTEPQRRAVQIHDTRTDSGVTSVVELALLAAKREQEARCDDGCVTALAVGKDETLR